MSDAAHKTTPAPRWVWHDDTFASLMLGRVQLAQISQGAASRQWFWTLYFCKAGERPSYSAEDVASAVAVAEAHARRVLAAADASAHETVNAAAFSEVPEPFRHIVE